MTFFVTITETQEPYLEAKLSMLECDIISITFYGENLYLYKVQGTQSKRLELIKCGYIVDEEMFGVID